MLDLDYAAWQFFACQVPLVSNCKGPNSLLSQQRPRDKRVQRTRPSYQPVGVNAIAALHPVRLSVSYTIVPPELSKPVIFKHHSFDIVKFAYGTD